MGDHHKKYKPTTFLEQHRSLFKGFSFKLINVTPEIKQKFTRVLSDLGGKVSDDGRYILAGQDSAFSINKGQKCYSFEFILNSIHDGRAHNIQLYRIPMEYYNTSSSDDSEHDFPKDCKSLDSDSSENDDVHKNESAKLHSNKMSEKRSREEQQSMEVMDDDDSSFEVNKKKAKLHANKMSKRRSQEEPLSMEVVDNNDNLSFDVNKNKKIKLEKKSEKEPQSVEVVNNDDSSSLDIDELIEATCKNIDSENSLTANLSKSNSISENGKIVPKKSQNGPVTSKSNNKWIDYTHFTHVKDSKEKKNDEEKSKKENKEIRQGKEVNEAQEKNPASFRKEWWEDCPVPDGKACQIANCTFEPNEHYQHKFPTRFMSECEKRILLKYLIRSGKIKQAKGLKVWKTMHESGYLLHRSEETCRNILRRTILPQITDYGLPEDILDLFLEIDTKLPKGKNY